MAKKLKSPRFGRQLFKKKSINSNQGGIDADDQSTTSSLNSDLSRSHGPIDVDNCTSGKHNSKTRHMFNGGSRRSRSKSNEQKSRNTLTKIVESRNNSPTQSSTSSSSSKLQHDENIDGSNHSKKSVDTDCHGKDVFERSRSDMSHMLSASRAATGGGRGGEKNTFSPTSHRTDSPNGSTDTPNGEETSGSSSNGSSNNSSPSNSNNTRSPSSMSPFSLQLSNFPLFGRTSSLVSPRSAARDAARKEEEDTRQKKQSDNTSGDTKACQQKEPSPTSVLQLIVDESSGSSTLPAYPVEFNTTLSNGGDNNNDGDDNSSGRYSITEYKGDKYDTDSSTLPLSLSPTKSSIISPKRSSPSSSSASSSMSKVFNKFWEGTTSSNYTSLEDVIDTHHESLLAPSTPPEETATTMKKKQEKEEVAVIHAMELVKSNKDFLSLKKDTEKNEFINNKNISSLSQRSSSTPIRVVLPPSTKDTTAITASGSNSMGSSQLLHECKKNKKMLWTLGMGMRRSSSLTNNRRPSDFEDTTSSMTTNLLDGTGTSSSRSRSSSPSINITDSIQMGEPASPNAFPQDILVGSPRGSSSSQGQQQVATETNNKNVTLDNIVESSFSFDNQDFLNDMGLGAFPTSAAGVQQQQNNPNIDLDSLSSEEESYLSNEIEDIDSITICEETERMINEHKAYVDSVKSNSCHPSRSISSIMKVSLATAGSTECSIQTEPEAGGESNKIEEQTRIKTSRLTWYDDEENWTKPFTLRTDESFDASTMTSGRYGSTNNKSTTIVGVNQWMDGIMKGMICGGEEDVESYDVGSDQQEI